MSVSAISSNQFSLDPTLAASSGLTGNLQSLADNYNALGTALQEGDLGGAQTAFTSLMQAAPSTGAGTPAAGSSSSAGSNSAGADFATLGQALQSGNLQGAQQAFANLQQAVQSAGGSHGAGHSHGAKGASAGGSGGSGASASASGASGDSSTVVSEVTVTNANGTLTVTSTYADGTTSTAIEPNPNPTFATNKLDPSNSGQQATLLAAQEQSKPV